MKKSYWTVTILSLVILFSSCKKKDDTNTNFKVNGISDVTVAPSAIDGVLQLYVAHTGSVNESVSFSLESLPAGCSFSVDSAQYTLPCLVTIHFKDTAVVPGTYPVKLICEGAQTGKQTYPFNLIANAETDYRGLCTGFYAQSTSDCNPGIHYPVTIVSGEKINKIYLNNIDNAGDNVYAMIYESGNTMVIPEQTVNGIKFSGKGSIHYTKSFTIYLTKPTPAGSVTCTIGVY